MSTETNNKKAAEKANENVKNVENSKLNDMAMQAKKAADELLAKAKEAEKVAKKAAAEAKEAAKKAKAFTSRPVRKCTFEVCERDHNVIAKSDVHYCAEKTAIDALAEIRATADPSTWADYGYLICKVSKELGEDGKPISSIVVSTLTIDKTTGQIVID